MAKAEEAPNEPANYAQLGPCATRRSSAIPVSVGLEDSNITLQVTLTAPDPASCGLAERSCPLVHLLNGFQLPSSYYEPYAQRLATWGYVSIQYDLPGRLLKRIIPDDKELALSADLRIWALEQARDPSSIVYGLLDEGSVVAAMGHSRGAKLAALMLAGDLAVSVAQRPMDTSSRSNDPAVSAAVLIDPVDMTSHTKSMGYPSAVDALEGKGKKVAMIGAGLLGLCNPIGEAYPKFWPVLAAGSWQQVVLHAGHMQFTAAAGPVGWALDRFCGAGSVSHEDVMNKTASAAAAWLDSALRPERAAVGMPGYMAWLQGQVDAGSMTFLVKQEDTGLVLQAEQFPAFAAATS